MRWQGGRRSGNIEDRRGMGAIGAGGIGIGGLVLAAIGYFVFGIDPTTTLGVVQQVTAPTEAVEGQRGTPDDLNARFVDVIETSTTDVWTPIFKAAGRTYDPPAAITLYSQATPTACGTGQSAMGPFYCPPDRKVYLDLAFWDELETKFGAGGEAARAYVIAHEIGHHVQNLTGEMEKAEAGGRRGAESGQVRLELQADCYAGVWAARASTVSGGEVALDPKDIEDGLRAAAAVGDDTLQQQAQGRIVPDAFTHGTSAQRMRWFRAGVENGDPAACNTFAADRL